MIQSSRKGADIQALCEQARAVGNVGGMALEAWMLEAYGLGLKDAASSETGPSLGLVHPGDNCPVCGEIKPIPRLGERQGG